MTASAADRVSGVHVIRLRQLVKSHGDDVCVRLTPLLLLALGSSYCRETSPHYYAGRVDSVM